MTAAAPPAPEATAVAGGPGAAAAPAPVQEQVPKWLALPVRHPRGVVSWAEITLPVVAIVCAYALPSRLVLPGLGAAGRPTVVLGIGLLLLWLLMPLARTRQPDPSWPLRFLLALYWISIFVSFAVGFDRGLNGVEASSAYRNVLGALGVTGLLLAVAEGTRSKAALDRILGTVVVGAAIMSLIGLVQAFGLDLTQYIRVPGLTLNRELITADVRGDGGFARVAGTAQHYIEYGTTAALSLPLAIHFWRRQGAKLISWSTLTVMVIGLAVPFSVSRTSFIAAAVTLLFLMLAMQGRQRLNMLVAAAGAVVFFNAAQPGVLGTVRALFFNASNDPSIQGRTDDYPIVAEYIADRPLLGRGTGTFEPTEYLILDNQILMTILTQGFVGLAVLGLLLGGAMVAVWAMWTRTRDRIDRELGLVIMGTIVAGAMVSATFDSFAFPTFTTTLWVLVGSAFALLRLAQADQQDEAVAAAMATRSTAAAAATAATATAEVPAADVAAEELPAEEVPAPAGTRPEGTAVGQVVTCVPLARSSERHAEATSSGVTWEREWWIPGHGPTQHARHVFRGDDAWLLAWVIHRHTDGALAVIGTDSPDVEPSWRPHVLVEVSPGTFMDVDGPHDEAAVTAFSVGRPRILRVTGGITFQEYALLVTGAEPATGDEDAPPDEEWWSVSSRSTASATRYVASRLLLAHKIPHRGLRSG